MCCNCNCNWKLFSVYLVIVLVLLCNNINLNGRHVCVTTKASVLLIHCSNSWGLNCTVIDWEASMQRIKHSKDSQTQNLYYKSCKKNNTLLLVCRPAISGGNQAGCQEGGQVFPLRKQKHRGRKNEWMNDEFLVMHWGCCVKHTVCAYFCFRTV